MRSALLIAALLVLAAPARAQWEPVVLPPQLGAAQIALFGFLTALGDHVYASTGFPILEVPSLNSHFVYASHDGGATWAPETAFTIPPNSGGRVGRPAAFNGAVYIPFLRTISATNIVQTVARTTDGTTWTFPAGAGLPPQASGQMLSVTRHQGALFVNHGSNSTQGTAALYRSADDGATWAAVGAPRTPGFLWTAGGQLLLGRPGTVLTGERSADGGLTWTPHLSPPPLPVALNIVDAALSTDGVAVALPALRSTDGGATWTRIPGLSAGTIAACGAAFVAGGGANLVSISTDGGITWTPWGDGLPAGTSVLQVACSSEAATTANALSGGGYVYAVGTGGLFRRPLAQVVAAETVPVEDALGLAVTPNPSSTAASLRVTLAESGIVRVTLTDALGREVLALDRALSSGAQTLLLDVSGLAPGVYVARLVTSGASASVRLTVAR